MLLTQQNLKIAIAVVCVLIVAELVWRFST